MKPPVEERICEVEGDVHQRANARGAREGEDEHLFALRSPVRDLMFAALKAPRREEIGTFADKRPLLVNGTLYATYNSVLADLRNYYPDYVDIRERVCQHGLIIRRPNGISYEGIRLQISVDEALRAGDGVGYVSIAGLISDIGPLGGF